ncbi:MAG: hypothetical protein JW717_12135, partial [Marinilabiliaceae bacterium]|nr:hypothetical protein [Marinilabiliaceae bacterium]
IGKISYGIYLFHLPLPALTRVLFEKFPGNKLTFHHEMISILFYTLLTIFLAHISFRFIEKPFLQLKTKFE